MRKEFLSPGLFLYYQQPLMVVEGHMQYVYDQTGRRYLDAFGGIVTVSAGHCHPHVTQAAVDQLNTIAHTTTIYLNNQIAEYAKLLASKMPGNLKCVYFVNSGSEANDLAILMARFLNKTRTGLNLRAVGESPATADAAGINVTKYKYLATCVGAGISGLGGVFYVMEYTLGTWANGKIIEGLGWLAVALVIFASWKPVNAIWGSYLFGFVYWAYLYIPGLGRSTQELFKMLPYVITLVVLIVVSLRKKRENQPPASLGLSYFREER